MDKKGEKPENIESRNRRNVPENENDVQKAHSEADKDIAEDPDFSASSPNDDLDEGESARLGEDKTGLV